MKETSNDSISSAGAADCVAEMTRAIAALRDLQDAAKRDGDKTLHDVVLGQVETLQIMMERLTRRTL